MDQIMLTDYKKKEVKKFITNYLQTYTEMRI